MAKGFDAGSLFLGAAAGVAGGVWLAERNDDGDGEGSNTGNGGGWETPPYRATEDEDEEEGGGWGYSPNGGYR